MAVKAKFKDTPERWKVFDRFHDAYLWGALYGVFNLKEDAKANKAFDVNDLATVESIIAKRIKAVGTKPKFKKVPESKRGMAARTVKGSRAYAGMLYEQKIYGKPKPGKPEKEKGKRKEKIKKVEKPVIERKPLGPPNPDLPQTNANIQARKKIKPNEIFLHCIHREDLQYTAVYYNTKTKKRRKLAITAIHVIHPDPAAERMIAYGKIVKANYEAKMVARAKEAKKKKKLEQQGQDQGSRPVKAKPKKKKTQKRM